MRRRHEIFLMCVLHFVADACINVEGDNMTMLDNSLDSCVKVPVNTETDGISKLFSLNVGRECAMNKSDVIVSLHFGNTTADTTCNDKIGILASNGTECGGWKVCKVIFQKGSIPTKSYYNCNSLLCIIFFLFVEKEYREISINILKKHEKDKLMKTFISCSIFNILIDLSFRCRIGTQLSNQDVGSPALVSDTQVVTSASTTGRT